MSDRQTFFKDGKIYFGDDPTEPVAFVADGFCDVFSGIYDARISLYIGMFGAIDLPKEADQIRLYYEPGITNWCWGKIGKGLDDFFVYRAMRRRIDGSTDKFLYLYDLRDNYIYRYPIPEPVWLMRWVPQRKAFEAVTGDWDNASATVKNPKTYIVRPPLEPHKTGGIYPDIRLVDCPEPQFFSAPAAPAPKETKPAAPEVPKSPIPGFYIIPGSFASRHPRTAFTCVFIGGAIMFALMIIGIIRSILSLF